MAGGGVSLGSLAFWSGKAEGDSALPGAFASGVAAAGAAGSPPPPPCGLEPDGVWLDGSATISEPAGCPAAPSPSINIQAPSPRYFAFVRIFPRRIRRTIDDYKDFLKVSNSKLFMIFMSFAGAAVR